MNNYRLNKKVEIKTVSTLRNEYGEASSSSELYCVRFAEVIAKKGKENFSSGADQATKKYTVRLRFDSKTSKIDESMMVVYAGKTIKIESVIDDGELHRWIILTCIEHNADNVGACDA